MMGRGKDKPDYEDEEGKGISFEDFKTQVLEDAKEEINMMMDEACVAGEIGTLMTQTFQNVAISPRTRQISFELPVIGGGVERYTVSVHRDK